MIHNSPRKLVVVIEPIVENTILALYHDPQLPMQVSGCDSTTTENVILVSHHDPQCKFQIIIHWQLE